MISGEDYVGEKNRQRVFWEDISEGIRHDSRCLQENISRISVKILHGTDTPGMI